jgi:hypothetical protein
MRVLAVCCWAVAVVAGCARDDPRARFTPPEGVARQALDSALTAWREGRPPGPVEGTSPVVQMVDSHRRPGQKLLDYTVLGPAPGDAPRVFAVRLTLDAPREEKRVRFAVLGIDPLWVMRYEDYEMLAHWDHPMDDESAKKARTK